MNDEVVSLLFHLIILGFLFGVHVCLLRHFVKRESLIFLVQVFGFVIGPVITTTILCGLGCDANIQKIAAFYGMSAVYGITFLWLWSITEGSYSLKILEMAQKGSRRIRQDSEAIGSGKQQQRLEGLAALRLIKSAGPEYRIRFAGKLIVLVTGSLAALSGIRYRE